MYKYPEYNPQSVGGYMNPRDYGNTMGSPVVPTIPSITTGMNDTPSFNYPSQTVGQLGNYYTPNVVPTPTFGGATVGGAMGKLGVMDTVNGWLGRGTGSFEDMYSGKSSAFGGQGVNSTNRLGEAVGTAGANAQTAWGKMSYGERGTAMLGAATGLYGAYNARKSGKLAREQLNFTKDSFNRNFEAQAKTTNSQLADRQNARHARDPKAHASVSDYMKKYGV